MKRLTSLLSAVILQVTIFVIPMSSRAQIYINEIMPCNVSSVIDDTDNYTGWLELYNSGSSSVSLTSYYFTDSLELMRYQITEDVTIMPGGFACFWFGRNSLNANHVIFKLEPEGSKIALFNTSQQLVDIVYYSTQYPDISYGRTTDGGNNLDYFVDYSFCSSNNNSQTSSTRCIPPSISPDAGFYSGSVPVEISTATPGATIYYTLDGSQPTPSSNIYTGTITLWENTPVRAICAVGGYLNSDISTATYFLTDREHSMPVVSIVTSQNFLLELTSDIERSVNFEFFDKSQVQQINKRLDVECDESLLNNQIPLSVKILPDKKYGNNRMGYDFFSAKPGLRYKSIMLRNSGNDALNTMLLDGTLQSLATGYVDIDCQGYLPAVLYVNGDYYGMDNVRERSNRFFPDSNQGVDEEDLYFVEIPYSAAEYVIGTDESVSDFETMYNFVTGNSMSNESNYMQAADLIDIDAFINYTVLQLFVNTSDNFSNTNYKLYRNMNSGRWRWIVNDLDSGFQNASEATISEFISSDSFHASLFNSLAENSTFLHKFIDAFCVQLGTIYSPDIVVDAFENAADAIRDEFAFHAAHYGIADNFDDYINSFETFAENRPAAIYSDMQSAFGLSMAADIYLTTKIRNFDNYHDTLQGVRLLFNETAIPSNSFNGKYFVGETLRVTALAPKGYVFVAWVDEDDNIVSTNQEYTFTVSSAATLIATFIIDDEYSYYKLYINEISSSNGIFIDENDGRDDWIEIYNGSNFPIDLGGMYITDKADNLIKARIPTTDPEVTTIEPFGYKIIWADKNPTEGELHVDIGLSGSSSETVCLSMLNGNQLKVLDSITYCLHNNATFGRYPDGGNMFYVMNTPSFCNSNIKNSADEFCVENNFAPDNNGDPYMLLSTYHLDFGYTDTVMTFEINNLSSSETLSWISSDLAEWMSFSAVSGNISSNESETVEVEIDRTLFSTDSRYIVTISGGDISLSLIITANVGSHTSIEEVKEATCSIFPNPVHGRCTLSVPTEEEVSVMIYSFTGTLVKDMRLSGMKEYSVDMTGIAKGLFFFKIKSASFGAILKLVVK